MSSPEKFSQAAAELRRATGAAPANPPADLAGRDLPLGHRERLRERTAALCRIAAEFPRQAVGIFTEVPVGWISLYADDDGFIAVKIAAPAPAPAPAPRIGAVDFGATAFAFLDGGAGAYWQADPDL